MGRKAGQKAGAAAATDDPTQSIPPAKKTKTAKVRKCVRYPSYLFNQVGTGTAPTGSGSDSVPNP